MTDQTFLDVSKLARGRCRTAVEMVLQLLEDDDDHDQKCEALLLAIASDMLAGAAAVMQRPDETEAQALGRALGQLVNGLNDAIRDTKRREATS